MSTADWTLASCSLDAASRNGKRRPTFVSSERRRHPVLISCFKSTALPVLDAGITAAADPVGVLGTVIHGVSMAPRTDTGSRQGYKKARDGQDLRLLELLKTRQWTKLSDFLEDVGATGSPPGKRACARFIKGCIKARKFKLADKLLAILEKRGRGAAVLAFSSAMQTYNKLHMFRSTTSVYYRMRNAGLELDLDCYRWIMQAYKEMGNAEMVVSLFLECKSKKWQSGAPFGELYAIICETLGRSGRAKEALGYLRSMERDGTPPNSAVYASVISSFVDSGNTANAEFVFTEAVGKGMVTDPEVFMKVVAMYVEAGAVEKALGIVKVMANCGARVTDCITCAVFNGYAKRRGPKSAMSVYQQLVLAGCELGEVTYASVVGVCARLGLPDRAELLLREMTEKGFGKNVVAHSSMISMYGKMGQERSAMRLLAVMKQKGCAPNVWVYNSLIDMYAKLKNLKQVEKLWKEMQRRNVSPDKVSYTAAIGAYNRAGKLDECVELYSRFVLRGGKIDKMMAGVMVAVFSKSGRVREMVELLKTMKLQGVELDSRLHQSALRGLWDAGLQVHVKDQERHELRKA